LEASVLQVFHEIYSAGGFPAPEEISVKHRENTGAGRYVDLYSVADVNIADGYLDLQGRFVRMSGVPNGLSATVAVEGGKLRQLEFAVYGDGGWDGEERTWAIV
jgi:hypothetical protein